MVNAEDMTPEEIRERRIMSRGFKPSKANAMQVAGTHYKDMAVEPWDVVDTWPFEQRIGAYRHGALKYLMRCGSKDDRLQEIKKCGHYIEKLIEVLEEQNAYTRTTEENS